MTESCAEERASSPGARRLLAGLLKTVPDALVGPGCRQRIQSLAGCLPVVRGGVALECRLDRAPARADFIVRVGARDRVGFFDSSLFQATACGAFLRAWDADPDDLGAMPYIDLEWDHGATAATPYITAMFNPHLPRGLTAIQKAAGSGSQALRMMHRVLSAFEETLAPGVLTQAERCFAALPADGFICHLGNQAQRRGGHSRGLRLIVSLPNAKSVLAAYLADLGWAGDADALWRLQTELCAQVTRIDLDIDAESGQLGSRVALYSTFYHPRGSDRAITRTLGRLAQRGLLVTRKGRGLAGWLATDPPKPAPERTLSLKFSLDAGGGIRAKAYLSLLSPF